MTIKPDSLILHLKDPKTHFLKAPNQSNLKLKAHFTKSAINPSLSLHPAGLLQPQNLLRALNAPPAHQSSLPHHSSATVISPAASFHCCHALSHSPLKQQSNTQQMLLEFMVYPVQSLPPSHYINPKPLPSFGRRRRMKPRLPTPYHHQRTNFPSSSNTKPCPIFKHTIIITNNKTSSIIFTESHPSIPNCKFAINHDPSSSSQIPFGSITSSPLHQFPNLFLPTETVTTQVLL